MIKINQCKIPVEKDSKKSQRDYILNKLHSKPEDMVSFSISKRSLDARKKPNLFFVYTFICEMKNETKLLKRFSKDRNIQYYEAKEGWEKSIPSIEDKEEVVIVGAGPAGLFAAYTLCLAGKNPIVVERGAKIEKRISVIEEFWKTGSLQRNTNVSFGEGGAGTFSDGKLNTGVKDKTGRLSFVLRTFFDMGAPENILYDAKPHIGTDLLRGVISNLRKKIEKLGGTFLFETQVTDLLIEKDRLTGVVVKENSTESTSVLKCENCILAIGHSARDTFSLLLEKQMEMEAKPFAVGVRVEHPQEMIDESQYGRKRGSLPAADYKLTAKAKNGRNVYSFCMCPGGFVVNASTEEGRLVVNGMSNHERNEKNANSAIIVNVTPEDFPDSSVLGGIEFQRRMEEKAWEVGNGKIPTQLYGDFQKNQPSSEWKNVTPSSKGGTILTNIRKCLPDYVAEAICDGMIQFGKRIHGFDREDAIFSGVETRTSSPVRILRREDGEAIRQKGIYPCGEGAGYAGGIMSAAMDGCKIAYQLIMGKID